MPDLFFDEVTNRLGKVRPLADRLKPMCIQEVVGQRHIRGENDLLRRMISSDTLGSAIFGDPPRTGKTTLAHVIANETKTRFESFNQITTQTNSLKFQQPTINDKI